MSQSFLMLEYWPLFLPMCFFNENIHHPLTKEWDRGCRQLIHDHFDWVKLHVGGVCRAPCVFGNLERCIPKNTFDASNDFWTKFKKVDEAVLFSTQYCYTHNQQCRLDKGSDLEVAGLPCWDYSLVGKLLGENGPTIEAFLTHAKRHVAVGTPLIIIENVKDRLLLKYCRVF